MLQSIQAACIQDASAQLFSPLPDIIDLNTFCTQFISDNGGIGLSSFSTCNIDRIMADLFNALDGPYAFNSVSLLGEIVSLRPLRNALKYLISLAR